jgi:tetratricopeptide (TPR) repeat protein
VTFVVLMCVITAAGQQQKVIKDQAEYNAYMSALNMQDPMIRATAMELFAEKYPQSVVLIDALEWAMASYGQADNWASAEGVARRIVRLMPNHVDALAVIVSVDRSKAGDSGGQELHKEICVYSKTGQEQLAIWTKPEGMTDADFEKRRSQMADVFNGGAGTCAQNKDYAETATALAPAKAHFDRGLALFDKGNKEGEIAELREAVRLKPGDADAHIALGQALFDDKIEDSIAEFRQGLRLKPGDTRATALLKDAITRKDAIGADVVGLAFLNLGNWNSAITKFREAIRIEPNYAEWHADLSDALRNKGDLGGALSEAQEAVRLDSHLAEAHYQLAKALEANGKKRDAFKEYEHATELDPKNDSMREDYQRRLGGPALAAPATAVPLDDDETIATWTYKDELDLRDEYSLTVHSGVLEVRIAEYDPDCKPCRHSMDVKLGDVRRFDKNTLNATGTEFASLGSVYRIGVTTRANSDLVEIDSDGLRKTSSGMPGLLIFSLDQRSLRDSVYVKLCALIGQTP